MIMVIPDTRRSHSIKCQLCNKYRAIKMYFIVLINYEVIKVIIQVDYILFKTCIEHYLFANALSVFLFQNFCRYI